MQIRARLKAKGNRSHLNGQIYKLLTRFIIVVNRNHRLLKFFNDKFAIGINFEALFCGADAAEVEDEKIILLADFHLLSDKIKH